MYVKIEISTELKAQLDSLRTFNDDTYEDIIQDLIEDRLELDPAFKKSLQKSIADYKAGRLIKFSEIKGKLKKKK